MTRKLLALYGLKWNPFSPDLPIEGLWPTPELEPFFDRLEQRVRAGGFALITGVPGSGKSVALRLLAHRLSNLPELLVAELLRPQSHLSDFYRELGHLFDIPLSPHNRWGGFKALREKWLAHLGSTLFRPVLLIDEAQEMNPTVLAELRLLASKDFDSRCILTIIFCGDHRLPDKLRHPDLLPLASRIRTRLNLDSKTPEELHSYLDHVLRQAGAPGLMTQELKIALCEHAGGNVRSLFITAEELLLAAAQREAPQLDEKLFLEIFALAHKPRQKTLRDQP